MEYTQRVRGCYLQKDVDWIDSDSLTAWPRVLSRELSGSGSTLHKHLSLAHIAEAGGGGCNSKRESERHRRPLSRFNLSSVGTIHPDGRPTRFPREGRPVTGGRRGGLPAGESQPARRGTGVDLRTRFRSRSACRVLARRTTRPFQCRIGLVLRHCRGLDQLRQLDRSGNRCPVNIGRHPLPQPAANGATGLRRSTRVVGNPIRSELESDRPRAGWSIRFQDRHGISMGAAVPQRRIPRRRAPGSVDPLASGFISTKAIGWGVGQSAQRTIGNLGVRTITRP